MKFSSERVSSDDGQLVGNILLSSFLCSRHCCCSYSALSSVEGIDIDIVVWAILRSTIQCLILEKKNRN